MIGYKIFDIGAGKKAGTKTILIQEPHIRDECLSKKITWEYSPDYVADDFCDAVVWILKQDGN